MNDSITKQPPRISTNLIINALEDQIKVLEATPKDDPKLHEVYWRVGQLKEQVEALKYRPTHADLTGWGGDWLGTVREWIKSNFRNGSDVTWGGHEPLIHTSAITASKLERLAALIASDAIRGHLGTYIHRVKRVNGHAVLPERKKSHYDWLDANLVNFLAAVFNASPDTIKTGGDAASFKGMISAHGDKCYLYREGWRANGIPFPHGVAIYLLSYIPPWSNTCRQVGVSNFVDPKQWVVDKYEELKSHLPPVTEDYESW